MAFLQPLQRHAAPRLAQEAEADSPVRTTQQRKRPLEQSQEWILFSPASASQSQTTRSHTQRTFSRVSDFGSLETGLPSNQIPTDQNDNLSQLDDDEAAELDSLDDGLHAFHAPSSPRLDQSGGTVLPTHDGLGTFPTSYNYADNEGMQEQLWRYERYNPHRRRTQRRRSDAQPRVDTGEHEESGAHLDPYEERRLRVEKWRAEQSKAVLEEIEKETRRRQRRMSRLSGGVSSHADRHLDTIRETGVSIVRLGNVGAETASEIKPESESFWQRITRRVIRDLIGLDDNTLSVIFGEELHEELSATPTRSSPIADMAQASSLSGASSATWEKRLLDYIAGELGVLVNELSEIEGAFETYNSRRRQPLSFIETADRPSSRHSQQAPIDIKVAADKVMPLSHSDPMFRPTLQGTSPISAREASIGGMGESPENSQAIQDSELAPDTRYWEQDPSVLAIFSYLRNRFASYTTTTSTQTTQSVGPLPPSWATTSALGTSPESQRRADLIRRHHPLVSRAAERRREGMLQRRLLQQTLHKRAVSSSSTCASQSTKRSRRSSGTGTGASRKYWDFPGGSVSESVGSSGAAGGGGGWGEV